MIGYAAGAVSAASTGGGGLCGNVSGQQGTTGITSIGSRQVWRTPTRRRPAVNDKAKIVSEDAELDRAPHRWPQP